MNKWYQHLPCNAGCGFKGPRSSTSPAQHYSSSYMKQNHIFPFLMPKSINGLKLIIVMLMDEVDIILTSRSRFSTYTHKRNWKSKNWSIVPLLKLEKNCWNWNDRLIFKKLFFDRGRLLRLFPLFILHLGSLGLLLLLQEPRLFLLVGISPLQQQPLPLVDVPALVKVGLVQQDILESKQPTNKKAAKTGSLKFIQVQGPVLRNNKFYKGNFLAYSWHPELPKHNAGPG